MKTKNFISYDVVHRAYIAMYFDLLIDFHNDVTHYRLTKNRYFLFSARNSIFNLKLLRSRFDFLKKAPF